MLCKLKVEDRKNYGKIRWKDAASQSEYPRFVLGRYPDASFEAAPLLDAPRWIYPVFASVVEDELVAIGVLEPCFPPKPRLVIG